MKIAPSRIKIGKRVRINPDAGIRELSQSIKELGQLQPVAIDDAHNLIAGARRVRACELIGIDVDCFIVTEIDDAIKRLKAERDENTCRLDFTTSEAVALGKRLEALEKPRAAERKAATQAKPGNDGKKPAPTGGVNLPQPDTQESGKTRDKVAAAVGMSGRTYEKAKEVVEAAEEPDAPPVIKEIKEQMDRTGNVDAAYKKIKSIKKAMEHEVAAEAAAKTLSQDDQHHVILGDFREIGCALPSGSVALIFTDPPYDRESLPLFSDLASFANRVLVDGGSLVTFCGQYVLPEVIRSLETQLTYFWINCCLHTGETAQMREYGIKVKWKPMLWFVKGRFRRDRETWVEDLVQSEQQKTHHPWQQSVIEASYFIERLSKKNEFVVDPFCGGGTTAVAAKQLGRRWWTCDIEATHVKAARERVGETK